MQQQTIEQIYSRYFCMPENIDGVYHRKYTINGKYMAPQIRFSADMDDTELALRRAMSLYKSGEIKFDATFVPLSSIKSVLMNIPEIKDQDLQKRVLHYFRLFGNELNRIIHGNGEDVLYAVARAAVPLNLATNHDYACCVRNTKDEKERELLINDLIKQAKSDIELEKSQNVPDINQIRFICENVINVASSLPEKTREGLVKEFQQILVDAQYIENADVNKYKGRVHGLTQGFERG